MCWRKWNGRPNVKAQREKLSMHRSTAIFQFIDLYIIAYINCIYQWRRRQRAIYVWVCVCERNATSDQLMRNERTEYRPPPLRRRIPLWRRKLCALIGTYDYGAQCFVLFLHFSFLICVVIVIVCRRCCHSKPQRHRVLLKLVQRTCKSNVKLKIKNYVRVNADDVDSTATWLACDEAIFTQKYRVKRNIIKLKINACDIQPHAVPHHMLLTSKWFALPKCLIRIDWCH